METIQLFDDLKLPAQYMVSNIIENTQPENILKYKYVYGTWDSCYWTKMFIVPMAVRSVLFHGSTYESIPGAVKVRINSSSYTKIKMLIPDLLFVVKNTIDSEDLAYLYVFRISGQFDPTNLSNLSPAPMPNLYDSGQVCQSGKISVLKMFKDSISYISKNSFEISEYFIDMFLSSAYNNDLDGLFSSTVRNLGFESIDEYIKTASNPNKFSFLKEKFIEPSDFNSSVFRSSFLETVKSNKLQYTTELFENDYLQMGYGSGTLFINMPTDDVCINRITIGDNIKYNGEFVRVLSFGPFVTHANILKNETVYEEGHYIKYMTESFKIGTIHFSEIRENVELGRPIELDECDYPKGCGKDVFILSKRYYRRIMGIVKIEGNEKYFYKLASEEYGEYIYLNLENHDCMYQLEDVYARSAFASDFYHISNICSSNDRCIISVHTDQKFTNEYVDKNLLIANNHTMFMRKGNKIVVYDCNDFIEVEFFESMDVIEKEHTVHYDDNTILPQLTEFRCSANKNNLYGINIDSELYSHENISREVNKLVKEWNEQGKTKNTVMKKKNDFHLMEMSIGEIFRLPIISDNQCEYCDQYILKEFTIEEESDSVFSNFQNIVSGRFESVPLGYLMKFYSQTYYPKNAELFRSEIDEHNRYLNQYVSIKESTAMYIYTTPATCQISNKRKILKIIDVDFSSSDVYNKFFASDRIIYCIAKEIDPFESIFDIKNERDFTEHQPHEIVLSDGYKTRYYIPNSVCISNNLIQPKYNQIVIGPRRDEE